ncbi:MAG: PQQ-binding-like beta-propeller repeat protein [Acidobacteria bacterium]|nr:PQQ-binding-like beta-propeller repeat protein [Acidobacteriota bacterium]
MHPQPNSSDHERLRLWPALAVLALMWAARMLLPVVMADAGPIPVLVPVAGSVLIALWWLFLSHAPWLDRVAGLVVLVAAVLGTRLLLHESLLTVAFGVMYFFVAVPTATTAFVLSLAASERLQLPKRRFAVTIVVLAVTSLWALARTGGLANGGGGMELAWRWQPTPEQQLIAAPNAPIGTVPVIDVGTEAAWPGFRGPGRDSRVRGTRIATDWDTQPPRELWRRPVGPGWSSFAVRGDVFYTQEQRGEAEVVSAYSISSGEPLWRHEDSTRFWEAIGGAGPRATPTLHGDRVYAFGATGILNALRADTGVAVWSRDVADETGVETPGWGFASSPVVIGDLVIVAARSVLSAHELATGAPRWQTVDRGGSYSSPQLYTIDGVQQVLLATVAGLISVDPATGTTLWTHEWPGSVRIVQPARVGTSDLLVSRGETTGIRRIALTQQAGAWSTREVWDQSA